MNELKFNTVELIAAIQADIANDTSLRASAEIDELATAILALDGVQECDLAAALLALDGVEQCELAIELVLRNRRLADAIATTIYDALREEEISAPLLMLGTATELVEEEVADGQTRKYNTAESDV